MNVQLRITVMIYIAVFLLVVILAVVGYVNINSLNQVREDLTREIGLNHTLQTDLAELGKIALRYERLALQAALVNRPHDLITASDISREFFVYTETLRHEFRSHSEKIKTGVDTVMAAIDKVEADYRQFLVSVLHLHSLQIANFDANKTDVQNTYQAIRQLNISLDELDSLRIELYESLLDRTELEVTRAKSRFIGGVAVVLLFLLFSSAIFYSLFNRPLKTLERFLEGNVRERSFDQRLDLHGAHELRAISNGINRLLDAVNETTTRKDQLEAIISDRTEKLEQSRIEAESANRAKSNFLASMSHEIRTPLNGVVGTLDIIGQAQLEEDQRELLKTANDSVQLLQQIIDDILDYSKIEADNLNMEQVNVNLEELLNTAGDNLVHMARKNSVRLLTYCEPGLPLIIGDPTRLKQILFNLTGNAIKFSRLEDRQGIVKVSITHDPEHSALPLCVQVSDNGIGMDVSVQSRLFKAFSQGEEDTTRRFGGTGLGLVITARLVEAMGGTIEVNSEPGRGSSFIIHLPLLVSEDAADNQLSELLLAGVHVYMLEAETPIHAGVYRYLQHAGASVSSLASLEGVDIGQDKTGHFRSVVVALHNGADPNSLSQFCMHLDDELDVNSPRLILTTGCRRTSRRLNLVTTILDLDGMHRETLIQAVAVAVGLASAREDNEEQQFENGAFPVVFSGHRVLLAEDNSTNQKVISQQLRSLGLQVDIAGNGLEALDLLANNDYSILLSDCHMPEMDGYTLARKIREQEAGQIDHLIIVAITADAMQETASACLSAGMNDYLTKPLRLAVLTEALEKWLHHKSVVEQAPVARPETISVRPDVPVSAQPASEAGLSSIDSAVLPELVGIDDSDILKGFYQDFYSSSQETMAALAAAYDCGDLDTLRQQAHKLKSSARTIGAASLSELCQGLEQACSESAQDKLAQLHAQAKSEHQQVLAEINRLAGSA